MPKKQKTFVANVVIQATLRIKVEAKDAKEAYSKAFNIATSKEALTSPNTYARRIQARQLEVEQAPDEKELKKINPRKKMP